MVVPRILVVDDQPEAAKQLLRGVVSPDKAVVTVRHPQEITPDDISTCGVVAVDHYLDDWVEVESQIPAMSPRDGFALAAVLRSQVPQGKPGPAFSILTGRLPKLAGHLPLQSAQHLLAWQHDVEWVFSNSDAILGTRLIAMAEAVQCLRDTWTPSVGLEDLATNWLALPDLPWRGVALDHIFQTRPPIHALGAETGGSSVLRWFLQRIWPYPTFLMDIHWTATRIGVTSNWLESEFEKESEVRSLLGKSVYSGAFGKFGVPRWWRAGVADAVVELSEGQPFDREALNAGLRKLSANEPEFLKEGDPVMAVDPTTMEATQVVDAGEAVQICPDGWPVYAEVLWATFEDVLSDPDLKDIVQDPSFFEVESEH